MAKDFLALNLSRIKKGDPIEGIEESMSSLGVSGRDFTLPRFNDPHSEIYSGKTALLHEGCGDIQLNYLDQSKAISVFPIFTSPARSGSISSGQPVVQNNIQETSTLKDNKLSSTRASSQTSFTRDQSNTAEESQLASKISTSYSSSSLTFEGEPSTSRISTVNLSNTSAKQIQHTSQNLQTPNTSTSTKSVLTSEANTPFIFSTNTVPQVVSTPQTESVPVTTSSIKGSPFKLPANTNAQGASLSPPHYFGSSVASFQVSSSSPLQQLSANLGKSPNFTSVVTSSTPTSGSFTFTPTFDKIEPANSIHSSNTAPLNPLASLNSLVSGMEPSKPFSQTTTPIKDSAVSNNMSSPPQAASGQPFVFKFPNAGANKVGKEEGIISLKTNVPSLPLEKKKEPTESENAMGVQSKFSGAFNNLSFGSGSPQISIFGKTPPSTPPKAVISPNTQTNESDQTPRNMLSLQKTPSTSAFSITTFATPTQKTLFGGTPSSTTSSDTPKPLETLAETLNTIDNTSNDISTSTVIEVSLSPSKSLDDTKTCLEKLSAATNVTITKVDPAEKKIVEQTKPEANSNSSSLFSSFSLSSPSTPTKLPPSIFGGSSPTKPSVTYEIAQPEPQSSEAKPKEENKLETTEKEQESPKPQSLFGDGSLNTKPTTSFSFSVSTLQSSLTSSENTQPISSGLSFGVKLPTSTSISASSAGVSSEPKSSTFSFAQATTTTTTQPASTAFSFAITTAPSTASSSFGFGNLAPFSENKPKSEFSFGQQAQTLASTPSSVFSGFSSKPTDTSTIFGGSTATTGENKNAFGQVVSSSVENKSIFGQPLSAEPDTQKGFSFSLSSSSSTTTVQSSVFGSPATTAASFFGQPICSPTSTTSSPFGQPTSTSSVFGSVTSTPFGGTSGFGSKPTFGQSGGSFFGQTRYEICIHNS